MNISITGNLGSGKSSICKILKEKGYDIISAGSIFRELAIEHNMSVEDFNQKVNEDIKKGDRSVDDMIDQRTTRIDSERDNVVFDSRLAWNFAPRSFKVFVMVDIEEAARRVCHDVGRSDSETYESVEMCRDGLANRQELEKQRFKELYSIDYFDMGNYNLIVETTNVSPEVTAAEILRRFEQYQQGLFQRMVELNPVSVFPTRRMEEIEEDTAEQLTIGQAGGVWFVCEGHQRLLNACRAEEPLVEVCVKEALRPVILSEADYREFEKAANVTYKKYPETNKVKRPNLLVFPAE